MPARSAQRPVVLAACAMAMALAPGTVAGRQNGASVAPVAVISGRIVDPHGIKPATAALMLVRQVNESTSSASPVALAADGSFVTPRLPPGTYVLELVRDLRSSTLVGLEVVTVAASDVSGVSVEVRRDTVLTGRFRMESDDPKAEGPPTIVVSASLALDGMALSQVVGASREGGGTFVLRNAFGPRVLRTGYTLAPGSPSWWFSRIVLDGRDITNVPTDFSEHPDGQLEVVFTQHPAQISGTVTDARGQPVSMPWITLTGADPTSAHAWSTTSDVAKGDESGRFYAVVPPGTYRVNAVPAATFASREEARAAMSRIAFGGVTIVVAPRGDVQVALTLQER